MELVRNKVLRFIREHALFKQGDTLVIAFSGGADSTALLDILAHLRGCHLDLVVAHLNHRLRGAESEADEHFARAAAARYDYPFACAAVDVAALAEERGLSLEEAGREARYAFFRKVAGEFAAAAVAVGHHQDDQAETALMRLLRGAGGSGLAGMRPKSAAGMIVRPLLSLRRKEIEQYLRKAGLAWREDSSNVDVKFLRNRIRHELLPQLAGYNPEIVERLNQTAAALAADEEVLETVAAGAFCRTFTVTASGAEADLDRLLREAPALRKRLYRKAIQSVRGDLRGISFTHLAAIEGVALAARPNSELALPGGIRVIREYRSLRFALLCAAPLPAGYELSLDGPGFYILPCGGSLLLEERVEPPAVEDAAATSVLTAYSGKFHFPLTVRYFRNGDRFTPLGMSGHKKLKDLFIDRKVPLKSRRRIPLLVDQGEIVWICGVQASEKTKTATVDAGMTWLRLSYTAASDRH